MAGEALDPTLAFYPDCAFSDPHLTPTPAPEWTIRCTMNHKTAISDLCPKPSNNFPNSFVASSFAALMHASVQYSNRLSWSTAGSYRSVVSCPSPRSVQID